MKISVAWIFDHIEADLRPINIEKLVSKFNQVTAEIEHFNRIQFDLTNFFMARVEELSKEVTLFIPELNQKISLSAREDAHKSLQSFFMVKQVDGIWDWANLKDFDSDKESYLPAFRFLDDNHAKGWKQQFESEDIILDVDNKSLTHRPDMWGHRGFAREVAALLDLPFKEEKVLLASHKIKQEAPDMIASHCGSIIVENREPQICTRLATLQCSNLSPYPSDVKIASRLLKVGMRPINAIVDLTNYVMLDWSQPMHAFDTSKLSGHKFVIRMAKEKEKLMLLDGKEVELTEHDLVTADNSRPLSLAGIKGGAYSGITNETKSIFLEAASFDPTTIRRSALRHKTRTESSARFEKTLDPNQVTSAILRFIKLAKETHINLEINDEIVVMGESFEEKIITLSQKFIEERAGFTIPQNEISSWLRKIGFGVEVIAGEYKITVPSFRGTKDVDIKEDILEEIFRFYGFNNIKPILPEFAKAPADLSQALIKRKIKEYLAYAAGMNEVNNYAIYDEQFLKLIEFDPLESAPIIKNPISENNIRLVTSLIPHLLKNVQENITTSTRLSFFELARRWDIENSGEIKEIRTLSGIFFNKHGKIDFYECKEYLNQMLRLIGLNVNWKKEESDLSIWMNKHQTAMLINDKKILGVAGKIDSSILLKIDALPESEAFVFELDFDLIMMLPKIKLMFNKIPKFQDSSFDLSFIIPLHITVEKLQIHLCAIDPLITKIFLIDYFEKPEWTDKKALAFRFILNNPQKTLDKDEIETVRLSAISKAQELGATLRS